MNRIQAVMLLSFIFLLGCSGSPSSSGPEPTTAAQATAAPTVTDVPQPTATATTGQVKGVVIGQVEKVNLIPIELGEDGTITYRAELLQERMMSRDVTAGDFLFEDVIPGQYMITANTGGGGISNFVNDQGAEVILEIEAGQVIDLGEVQMEG
jgi:hypothetical protein